MENNRIFLGKVGKWFWSNFYFDKETGSFTEEKYHEEYLDTGTVFDGAFVVLPQHIYASFVEELNFDGIAALLSCLNPQSQNVLDSADAEIPFLQEMEAIDQTLRKNVETVNGSYIIRNGFKKIIGVLFSNPPLYAYKGLYKPCNGFISKKEAFSYAISCLRDCYTPRTILIGGRPSPIPKTPAKDPNEKGLAEYEELGSILTAKK